MQNTKYLFLFIITLIFGNITLYTKEIKEIGEKYEKQLREDWLNKCRGGNDGINWQLIDNETRLSRYNYLLENYKNNSRLQGDKIANGQIEGKWIEKGSNNNAGRIRGVDVDFENNELFAISDGGNVFRGSLKGENWTCLNNSFNIGDPHLIKILKVNGKRRILAFTYGGKLSVYSDDEGKTWNISKGLDNPRNWGGIRRAVISNDSQNTIYLLGHEWDYGSDWCDKVVIYYSTDKGETYQRMLYEKNNLSMMDLWADRYETNKVFYFKKDSLFTLTPDSINYEKAIDLSSVSNPNELSASGAIYEDETNFGLCVRSGNNWQNYFLSSYDAGDSWNIHGSLDKGKFMMPSYSTSTYSVDMAYLGSVNLHISYDGGSTWDIINDWTEYYKDELRKLHADIPAIQFFRDPEGNELMFICTDGGLYYSEDYGSEVRNISLNGLNVSQYYSVLTASSNTNVIYVGAQDQGFQRADLDSGKTLYFNQLFSGDYGSISSSDEGNSLWSVYPFFVLYMRNAPVWNRTMGFAEWDFEGRAWHWMTPTRAVYGQPSSAYAIGGDINNGSYLWRFTANGSNEIQASKLNRNFRGENPSETLTALELSKSNTIYCASDRGVMHITKDGQNWEDIKIYNGENEFYANFIAIDPINQNFVYVGGRGYNTPGFFASADGGKTFTPLVDGLPNTYINGLAVSSDGKLVFAATSSGPYVFIKALSRWYSMATLESPDQDFRWVEFVAEKNTARFATYGRGIWDFKIENVNSIIENQNPINFSVEAFPNPTTETSTIKFDLPESGNCTVKIYDLQGHEIIKLYEGYLNKGSNSFNWNSLNKTGAKQFKGTYLCLVSCSGFTAYTKIELN